MTAFPRNMAFQVACRFPGRVPSGREVHAAFPDMARATAYRYARDYRDAWLAVAKQSRPDAARALGASA